MAPAPSESGSAAGRTFGSVTATVSSGRAATTPAGVHEQLADEEEERDADRAGQPDQQEHEEPLEEAPGGEHARMLPRGRRSSADRVRWDEDLGVAPRDAVAEV